MIVDKGSLSLEERVFSELEEEILSGKLGAGTRLKEQELSVRQLEVEVKRLNRQRKEDQRNAKANQKLQELTQSKLTGISIYIFSPFGYNCINSSTIPGMIITIYDIRVTIPKNNFFYWQNISDIVVHFYMIIV